MFRTYIIKKPLRMNGEVPTYCVQQFLHLSKKYLGAVIKGISD
jgi:hypothetical protein